MKAQPEQRIQLKQTELIDVGVQVLGTALFGLIVKVKVHYAETPFLSRKPFWVFYWKLQKNHIVLQSFDSFEKAKAFCDQQQALTK